MNELIPNKSIHRIEVVASNHEEDRTCLTYVLHHEDHTLGNSLRYVLMKNAEVEYCGYSVPHPSEEKINLRIQTREKPCNEVLKASFVELQKVCNYVLDTFKNSVIEFKERKVDEDVTMESEEDEEDDEDEEEEEDGQDN